MGNKTRIGEFFTNLLKKINPTPEDLNDSDEMMQTMVGEAFKCKKGEVVFGKVVDGKLVTEILKGEEK